ncbi:P-loop containing nucleoside triphosphate hydrolase protein [Anaeromyces robustus]|uniref:p-loop containing nucleoside triphosphate hydrolase protein n=1 Tax=Anaeromyces robustus TaxID=1754192 RepID=A0A1Y1WTB3_9FUNG|nr:P-loop containing nucleoside triphosphate hydrolase protein [Anaeromyces robustus]|eukprot:ORX76538.1 P-loop containing nucleoside triphosphate hydrolase protein [Anaeromyces robustus]
MRDYLRLKKRSNDNEQDTELKRFERYKSHGLQVFTYLPDELKYIIWPTVVAFSLIQKIWGYAIVSGIESVTPSSIAWNQLVLPSSTKEMLFATAAASLRGENPRDIVSSRVIGSLFLLYGAPGTGKTLTVESLARLFGRPLYSVSFAELGSNVTELEERLTDVLFLASHWGALILLDEGDALVEKRKSGQLMLNSMTSILLRLLESFDGTLFITSNRASSFDPAALSRVTLAIEYKPLKETGKKLVWKNALIRVFADEILENNERRGEIAAEEYVNKHFDLNQLGQFKGSGRSVNAVIRLAIGLSDKRDEALSQKIINDAIDVYTLFNDELLKECPESWD